MADFGWGLPPGCTPAMIDAQVAEECPECDAPLNHETDPPTCPECKWQAPDPDDFDEVAEDDRHVRRSRR